MRIKNQFRISIIIFIVILAIISGSIFVTQQQVVQLSNQETISIDIQTRASNLAYISNDYFLYQEKGGLDQWQTEFSSLLSDLSKLNISSPEQQVLINNTRDDAQRLNSRWTDVALYLENAPRNVSIRVLPEFQTKSSRMSLQNQALIFDAQQLSETFHTQIDQLNVTRVILVLTLLGLFGAYLITNYLVTYRKTLNSISELQVGIAVVGSGNLDYSLKTDGKDEVGEISMSVNQMVANLKNVTASKTDLVQAQVSLRESEQRWATTLASIGDAVIATDTSGKIVFMNGEAEELTGWKLSEASQKPVKTVFNIINEQTRLEVENPLDRVLREGIVVGLANHTVLIRKDGSEVPIDDSGAPIRDKDDQTTGVVLIFRDITERKKAEDALATAKSRLAQELAGSLRLQELSMIFVSQGNMQALLDKIVLAAIEIMHADMGNMQRISKDDELKIVAQSGFKQPFMDFFNCVGTDSHAACGFAMASKARVIIGDVTQSPIFLNSPSLHVLIEAGVRAVVSTPFFTRSGEFLGVISTHYRTARLPDEFDLRLLDLLVRQAADFVERTQIEQKLADYNKNLEKLVEERTKQLKDSERLAAIGATAGMVGHDIRNPLQAMTGDVYLAKTDLGLMPESDEKKSVKESLEEIEKNISYINKIVGSSRFRKANLAKT